MENINQLNIKVSELRLDKINLDKEIAGLKKELDASDFENKNLAQELSELKRDMEIEQEKVTDERRNFQEQLRGVYGWIDYLKNALLCVLNSEAIKNEREQKERQDKDAFNKLVGVT